MYGLLMAPCFSCKQIFASNPNTVPSWNNQPICQSCIEAVNRQRAAAGAPLWPVANNAYLPTEEEN